MKVLFSRQSCGWLEICTDSMIMSNSKLTQVEKQTLQAQSQLPTGNMSSILWNYVVVKAIVLFAVLPISILL